MRNRKSALALAISAAISTPAFAQLEEVIVTAQKRAQSLQDVPVAVSAFQGEQLENFGVLDTQSLALVTPSLVFNNRGPVAQPFIRGIGTTLSLLGLEPSVATYVDDQYYARPVGSIMELPDIERIEVLKGPQGTLYGRNATGGAIRVVTKDPTDEFEAKVKLSAGNYGYFGVSNYVQGGLTDNLYANFSVLVKQRDGFGEQKVQGLDDLDDLDTQTYRGKLLWDVSDSVTAKLALDYTNREDTSGSETIDLTSDKSALGGAPGAIGSSWAEGLGLFPPFGNVVPTGKKQDSVRSSVDGDNELEMFNAQLRFDVQLDGMVFSSMSTYQDTETETNTADFDASSLRLSDISDKENNEAFSQEFQLLSDNDSKLSWVTGIYYFESEGDYQIWFDGSDLVVTGFQVLASPKSSLDTTAWAVFGQATYAFDDAWSLTVGGRYSEEEKDITSHLPAGNVDDDEDWDEFTPTVTAQYDWDVGMAYLSYKKGFKSGGFAYPYIPGFSDSPVDSETLDMYELGLKADLLDDSLRVNGALYYYDYDDLQVNRNAGLVPGVGVVVPVENAGGAEVFGLEADITWLATDNLTVTGGFNAMNTEYTDYDATPSVYNTAAIPGPVVASVPYDAEGDDMIRAPDFSAFVSLSYDLRLDGGASLPIVVTYSHKGDYNFDLIPGDASNRIDEYESDSYELLSARMTYHSANEKWSVAAWGNNLTDEEYYDEVVAFATAVRATVGAPRTYGVDFTYNF
jgi:iron complex outermembrane receptor protein